MLLLDARGKRSVRLNVAGYAFAGRLDGQRTMQQLWELLLGLPGDPPTQDELIDMLTQLHEAGLVQTDRPADFARLLPHLASINRPRSGRSLLAWRVPLADPSRLLDRLDPLQQLLFSRRALQLWLAAMALLLALAVQHVPALFDYGRRWLATPDLGWMALGLYLPIKLVHELAHGLAVRRWGGHVREAGVTLMMGMPVPYVDASAAAGFSQRHARVAVGAAGVMAELALAAVALPLWLMLSDGPAREAAYVTLCITGVSALLFNANPLQRLDGYFVLTDALELPNLATRSRQWWLDLLQRRLLRLPDSEAMPVARGERFWLMAYAPLSWLYGLAMVGLAVTWLGQISLALGVLCGALLGWQMLLAPPLRLLRQLHRASHGQDGTARRWRRLAISAAGALAVALAIPLPQLTLVQAVVWPADQAQLRSTEEGFVDSIETGDGAPAEPGQVVLRLVNPNLQALLARQQSRVTALETEGVQAAGNPRVGVGDTRAGDTRAELAAALAELDRLAERAEGLTVRAQASGRVALPNAADLAGRFVRRGQLLGRVLTDEPTLVRAALPESEVAELRRAHEGVSVRLAGSPGQLHAASLLGQGGGAVLQLPSAALSARHGGSVATDPNDKDDLKPQRPVVLLDIRLDDSGGRATDRVGERAWVRFDSGLAPAGLQLARALRRGVQHRFNPQF